MNNDSKDAFILNILNQALRFVECELEDEALDSRKLHWVHERVIEHMERNDLPQ